MVMSDFLGRTDWAEQLEGRIRLRTDRRLRGLTISRDCGQVFVSGRAPSFYVRQLAEHAAMELLPAEQLRLKIEVAPSAVK
ncbi:MAG TPA: hypothetical protein VMV10_04410 [Pirellulales bacterium]|nr:hypothetical protein [Pirellulales bacterium]